MEDQPIIMNDEYSLHSDTSFCYDLSCPCHGNSDNLMTLHEQHRNGLVEEEHGITDILGGEGGIG